MGRRLELCRERVASRKLRVAFEFIEKLGAPFYCFHDRDVAPEGKNLRESNQNLDAVVKVLKEEQQRTGIKLLWGTANLFSNPRYVHGAATSSNADVFAFAAAQVKKVLEVTHELGGAGYVFWGGREGYSTLLNTDLKREQEHLAKFLHLAVDYKKAIGFKGQFFIEPKPKEPTKHQYDFDAAACLNFLREFDLLDHFQLNIETNPATLAGHTRCNTSSLSPLPSANSVPSTPIAVTNCSAGTRTSSRLIFTWQRRSCSSCSALAASKAGVGLTSTRRIRRESFEPGRFVPRSHRWHGCVRPRGLKIAAAIRKDSRLATFVKERYASWDRGLGKDIGKGKLTLKELEAYMLKKGEADLEYQRAARSCCWKILSTSSL